MVMNRIATIIVTYNGSRWIRKCLEHLLDSPVIPHIIIVDNNSTDDTIEVIKPFLQKIEILQLQSNLGFGGANNIGIQKALEQGYSHFFLLNQDAYVQKDCVSKLLETAISNPEYGILSPIQLDQKGVAMDPVFYRQVFQYYNPAKDKLFNEFGRITSAEPIEVRFVGAAAWFLSADLVKKAGFFHPIFFHYGEDNNFAARAQYFGFKIGIQVTTSVIHDRKPRGKEEFLPVKLRSFPLHQLLDIRKPFLIGWIVGFYQLTRTWEKLKKTHGLNYKNQFLESRSWFFSKINKALKVRREMKKGMPLT